MFPDFLPQEVYSLTAQDSIATARSIKRHPLLTSLSQNPINTAYIQWGTGDLPILLLHGFDSSLLEFRRLIAKLGANRKTWAVDLLGSGFTERISDISYNSHTITEHLYCFWRNLIKRPVILVGASMGGAAAMDLTLAHPEAVAKLVLINSVGYTGSFPIGQLLPEPIIELGIEFWRQRRIQSLFWGKSLGLLDPIIEDVIRCAALPSLMPGWDQTMKDFTRSGGYYRLHKRIPLIDKPTLILWGERDDVLGTEAAERFHKAIAKSRLVWLSGLGHSPQWEQPKIVARQILKFIKS